MVAHNYNVCGYIQTMLHGTSRAMHDHEGIKCHVIIPIHFSMHVDVIYTIIIIA